MALTVTPDPTTGLPTRLTIKSDKRIVPAMPAVPEVRESAHIVVTTADETFEGDVFRVVSPAVPGVPAGRKPITITDSRPGVSWRAVSDDGVTAVYEVVTA